jgi:hypothetical protein
MLADAGLVAFLARVAILLLITAVELEQILGVIAEMIGILGEFIGQSAAQPAALFFDCFETGSFGSVVAGSFLRHESLRFLSEKAYK